MGSAHAMTHRPCSFHMTAGPTMPQTTAANDEAILAILRRDLEHDTFRDVLAGLREELIRRLRSAQDEPPDWHRINQDARALLSLAVSFGFDTLAALTRAVLAASRRPTAHAPEVLQVYRAEVSRRLSVIAAMERELEAIVGARRGATARTVSDADAGGRGRDGDG